MKIIYFHQYFTTPKGSGGTRSYLIAKELVSCGHNVNMVCLNDSRSNTGLKSPFKKGVRVGFVEGIKITEININYSNHLNIFKRSLAFIKYSFICSFIVLRDNYDLAFASSTPLTIAIPGIISKYFKRSKFIFEVRDLWPELPKALGIIRNPIILFSLSALEWFAYFSADLCIGLSPGICKGIQKKGISNKKIYMVPNSSDLNLFRPLDQDDFKKPYLIPEFGKYFNKDSFIAAFTGAHGIANGLDSLLKVAIELKKRKRNDINLLFVGDGKCKENLIKDAKKNNLENCFFLSSIPKIELAKLLRESVHVGLMVLKNVPEFYDGTSPNKFFDYISCGLPIINNYPGWISKSIYEKNIGISVQPYDYSEFADSLIFLADNLKTYKRKSINARRLAENYYSSKKLARSVRELLEKLT